MKYKLLALDLDDTLLNEKSRISRRNIKAIRGIVEKGMMVTIATGRMFRSALPYARELEVDLPLITYHGALIKNAGSGEVLKHFPLPYDLALEILELGEKMDFHINFYFDDRLFVKEENENTKFYQQIAPIPVESVGELSRFISGKHMEPTKLTILNLDGRIDELQQMLQEKYMVQLSILQSRPHFLEITNSQATKGQALDFLARKEGILAEEIVAMGDSYNDLDMLQFAGLGVAVANAPEEVKNAADLITAPNTDDGVALFLEQHFLT